jgi:hypothetical protein
MPSERAPQAKSRASFGWESSETHPLAWVGSDASIGQEPAHVVSHQCRIGDKRQVAAAR